MAICPGWPVSPASVVWRMARGTKPSTFFSIHVGDAQRPHPGLLCLTPIYHILTSIPRWSPSPTSGFQRTKGTQPQPASIPGPSSGGPGARRGHLDFPAKVPPSGSLLPQSCLLKACRERNSHPEIWPRLNPQDLQVRLLGYPNPRASLKEKGEKNRTWEG